jgi:hypothetical protein
VCASADASFQRVADVKVTADLAHINRLAFVDKGRIAGHYGEIGKNDSMLMMSSLTPSPK